MENGFLKKAKQGLMGFRELKTKSGLRELILRKSRFWERMRGEEKNKRKKKKEKRISGMDYYGFVWICELLYGFLDSWSSSLSRVFL